MDSSLYHQHIDGTTHHHRVRPVVIGAPYVLCGFAVGVILMAVGTFITSHAYEDEERDPVLLGVGPGLLGLGALLLLSSVLMCVIACLRNRQLREALSDEFFTIGASTFYGGRQFVPLHDENHLGTQSPGTRRPYSQSGGATDPNDAVMILANTVAEERQRQRKNSRKYYRNRSYESGSDACYMGPEGIAHERLSREDPDHLGLEPIRRAERLPELPHNDGLSESDDSGYIPRDRSHSMSFRGPRSQLAPVEQRLRRNLTYTQASRTRIQQQQRQRQRQQADQRMLGWETQQPFPQRKRSSRRKKPQATINEMEEVPTVHRLPKYDPDLLRALGLAPDRPKLDRGRSENMLSASAAAQPASWREDPDVTHGSLGNPRRRPSVVMGVKGLRPKQSGAAYRHSSSIYASDMDLHRTDATVTSDASQTGHELQDFQNPSESELYPSHPGSVMGNRSVGSSPTLLPPYGYGDAMPQVATRRENTPTSTPSICQRRRPLSNISSASESCCSVCCEDSHDGEKGESNQEKPLPDPSGQGEVNHDNDERSEENDA